MRLYMLCGSCRDPIPLFPVSHQRFPASDFTCRPGGLRLRFWIPGLGVACFSKWPAHRDSRNAPQS